MAEPNTPEEYQGIADRVCRILQSPKLHQDPEGAIAEVRRLCDEPARRAMAMCAEQYYKALEEAQGDPESIQVLKERLDELLAPWATDLAFSAFLRLERLAKIAQLEKEGPSNGHL